MVRAPVLQRVEARATADRGQAGAPEVRHLLEPATLREERLHSEGRDVRPAVRHQVLQLVQEEVVRKDTGSRMNAIDLFRRPDPVQTWEQKRDAELATSAAIMAVDRSGWEDFGICIVHGYAGAPQVLIMPVPKRRRVQGNVMEPGEETMRAYSLAIH